MSQAMQINVSYNASEDRLLLRISTPVPEGRAEYRLWLTRRFVQLMWQGLDKSMEAESAADPFVDPSQREAVRQFKEEAALNSADFTTPYSREEVVTPLGAAPVLISRMRITPSQDGKKTLIMSGENGPAVNLSLSEAMIHSVRKLIADSAEKAGWGLSLPLLAQAPEGDSATPRVIN